MSLNFFLLLFNKFLILIFKYYIESNYSPPKVQDLISLVLIFKKYPPFLEKFKLNLL